MSVGSKVYMGKVFRGNRVASLARGKGFVTGTFSNGRRFILADRDLCKLTIR